MEWWDPPYIINIFHLTSPWLLGSGDSCEEWVHHSPGVWTSGTGLMGFGPCCLASPCRRLQQEPGHSAPRIFHCGSSTGEQVMEVLVTQVCPTPPPPRPGNGNGAGALDMPREDSLRHSFSSSLFLWCLSGKIMWGQHIF